MKNLTPNLEKVKKPRAKKVVDQETLAATASTITRKRESAKRIRVAPPVNIPVESSFARAENNATRDREEIPMPHIDAAYGKLVDPNNFEASKNRIDEALRSGEISLLEELGTDDFEEAHIQEAGATKRIHENPNEYEHRKTQKSNKGVVKSHDNLKTWSDKEIERNNRGGLRKFWDKLMDYVAPKDLYDDEEQENKPSALEWDEKAELEKNARQYKENLRNDELHVQEASKLVPKETPQQNPDETHYPWRNMDRPYSKNETPKDIDKFDGGKYRDAA